MPSRLVRAARRRCDRIISALQRDLAQRRQDHQTARNAGLSPCSVACLPHLRQGYPPRRLLTRPRARGTTSLATIDKETSMAAVATVVAKVRAAKCKGGSLAVLLKEQAGVLRRNEPGCFVYRPHRSTKDPDLFRCYAQYKDEAAFQAHGKAPHLAEYRE